MPQHKSTLLRKLDISYFYILTKVLDWNSKGETTHREINFKNVLSLRVSEDIQC